MADVTLHLSASLLAVVRPADGVALALLLAFTWWGARKGGLRQALSLGVLAGAAWLAAHHAADAEPTVGKLFELHAGERLAAAWAAVLFGGLVAGAILIRLLAHRFPDRSRGGVDRVLGGLLGAAKGAVVLTVVGYLVLALGSGPAGPSLSRTDGPAADPAGLSDRVRGSVASVCLTEWGGVLRRVTWLPPWIEGRVEDVNLRLQEKLLEGPPR